MISNPSNNNVDHSLTCPVCPSPPPVLSRLVLHDPALAHSCTPSSNAIPTPFQILMPVLIQAPVPKRTDALKPHAKPFVFATSSWHSGSFSLVMLGPQMQLQPQLQQQPHIPQPPRAFGHARGASFGKPLNAGAHILPITRWLMCPHHLTECVTGLALYGPWLVGCSPPCYRSHLSWCVTAMHPFP